jgi:Tfp pilus assembly protein PilX
MSGFEMTNLYRKKQNGAATFLITIVMLVSITLIVIFAANYSVMEQKISANSTRNLQAYEAAEAGLEFGINYLQKNSATILASKVGGYVQPYSDSNTITYSNPIASNYILILVSSTGVNNDGTATKVVSQLVEFGSILFKPPTSPITGKGTVTMTGHDQVINMQGNTTIVAGSTVSMSGSAVTQAQGGVSSTSGHINSDISQNNATFVNETTSNFFSSFFGASINTVKSSANVVYTNLGSYGAVLNNQKGVTIWIDQTSGNASISGNNTIGTSSQPVLLIVNGNLDITGNTTIYGFIVVLGAATTEITGSSNITGGILAADNLILTGSSQITYNSSIINIVQQSSSNYYAKVPGSWRDF